VKIRRFVAKASAAMLSEADLMVAATYHRHLQSWAQKPVILLAQNSPSDPTEPGIGVSLRQGVR
jgi:hypothetical protein